MYYWHLRRERINAARRAAEERLGVMMEYMSRYLDMPLLDIPLLDIPLSLNRSGAGDAGLDASNRYRV